MNQVDLARLRLKVFGDSSESQVAGRTKAVSILRLCEASKLRNWPALAVQFLNRGLSVEEAKQELARVGVGTGAPTAPGSSPEDPQGQLRRLSHGFQAVGQRMSAMATTFWQGREAEQRP